MWAGTIAAVLLGYAFLAVVGTNGLTTFGVVVIGPILGAAIAVVVYLVIVIGRWLIEIVRDGL